MVKLDGSIGLVVVVCVCLCVFLLSKDVSANPLTRELIGNEVGLDLSSVSSSGGSCVACTLVVGLLFEKVLMNGTTLEEELSNFCEKVKEKHPAIYPLCEAFDAAFVDLVQFVDLNTTSPDDLCALTSLCTNPQCVLFKTWPPVALFPPSANAAPITALQQNQNARKLLSSDPDPDPTGDFWGDLVQLFKFLLGGVPGDINSVFDEHIPMKDDDEDGDLFTNSSTLRGYSWRGRDCNNKLGDVYPGRLKSDYGVNVDHNCNGIYGSDPQGVSYEEMFCANSQQRGVVILGDSAAAHFRIPPKFFTAADIDSTYLDGILYYIENELDFPYCSWSSGYANGTNTCPETPIPVSSIYDRLRARNLCNHRDYTNIGVNGARTGSMASDIIESFRRNHTLDNPVLVFFALIGNDVCNGHPGLGSMTTPEEFETNVLQSLDYLENILPAGSHVVFVPLADGQILYEALANKTHPIGVPYPDIYDFLACTGETPCWGWMNTNATWRELTTERAMNLSAVYPKIISEHNYTNFEMVAVPWGYFDQVVQMWVAQGGDPSELIEPSDGFHPSTLGNALLAEYMWNFLEQNHPEVLGPVNPYNQQIQQLFGDQGGH